MTHSKTQIANAIQAISIPGYTGKLPRFQGNQPLFAAARFHSLEEIAWGYAPNASGQVTGTRQTDLKNQACHPPGSHRLSHGVR